MSLSDVYMSICTSTMTISIQVMQLKTWSSYFLVHYVTAQPGFNNADDVRLVGFNQDAQFLICRHKTVGIKVHN